MIPRGHTHRVSGAIYERFSRLPGSDHIATRTAISGLLTLLRSKAPENVLEIGAGIGTLTHCVLQASKGNSWPAQLVAVESEPFCLEQLRSNLGSSANAIRIVPTVSEALATLPSIDFLIADGGFGELTDPESPADPKLFARLGEGAVVFVEGGRQVQRDILERQLHSRSWIRADVRTLRRAPPQDIARKGNRFDGGYAVYRLEPSLGYRIWFFTLRLRTSIVHRLRALAR